MSENIYVNVNTSRSIGETLILAANAAASQRSADEISALRRDLQKAQHRLQTSLNAVETLFQCKEWLASQRNNLHPIFRAMNAKPYLDSLNVIESTSLTTIQDKDLWARLRSDFSAIVNSVSMEDFNDAIWMASYNKEDHTLLRNQAIYSRIWMLELKLISDAERDSHKSDETIYHFSSILIGAIGAYFAALRHNWWNHNDSFLIIIPIVLAGAFIFFWLAIFCRHLFGTLLKYPAVLTMGLLYWYLGWWWGFGASILTCIADGYKDRIDTNPALVIAKKELPEIFGLDAATVDVILKRPPKLPSETQAKENLMSTYQGNADRYNRIYNKLYGNGPVLPGLAQGFDISIMRKNAS